MRSYFFLLMLLPTVASADPLRVVTDILPVHSLVAQLSAGVTEPTVILSGNSSPHSHSFRPSEAKMLQDADLVIWVGPAFTPWLEDPLHSLAPDTPQLTLLETPGWPPLTARDDAAFEEEGHDQGDDHDDHGAPIDPHAWLSPDVASIWVGAIADSLSTADPDNALIYQANATTAQADLAALKAEIDATLTPVRGREYVVPHDALQYFEVAFDMPATGAIALSDAAAPGPAHIRSVQSKIEAENIQCVLSDPQVSPDWVRLVTDGTDAGNAEADTIGIAVPAGPDHYGITLRTIATNLAGCLTH